MTERIWQKWGHPIALSTIAENVACRWIASPGAARRSQSGAAILPRSRMLTIPRVYEVFADQQC